MAILLLILAFLPTPAARPQQNASPRTEVSSQGDPLDLNTASFAQLRALPGMGDAYVHRILEGRPYRSKNQLVTRGILPQLAYERIRDLVVAHQVRAGHP